MGRRGVKESDARAEIVRIAQRGCQLTTRQAAIYCGLKMHTLEAYRNHGKPPHYVKIGHAIRYPVQCLDEFLRASTFNYAAANPNDIATIREDE